jgi:hypothetical protein
MGVRVANGRWCRGYFTGVGDPICITYWKPVRGKMRQLTVSPKLMRQVLRLPEEVTA